MTRRAFFGIFISLLTTALLAAPEVALCARPTQCECARACAPMSKESCPNSCAFRVPETPPAKIVLALDAPAPIGVAEPIALADIEPLLHPTVRRWSLRDEIPRSLHKPFIDASRAPPALV